MAFRKKRPNNNDVGGGVALIYDINLAISNTRHIRYTSFEHTYCKLQTKKGPISLINIYRPPCSAGHPCAVSNFLVDFRDLLQHVTKKSYPCYILGDFNIHFEHVDKVRGDQDTQQLITLVKYATKFNNLLLKHGFKQLVKNFTRKTAIIDFVITQNNNETNVISLKVNEDDPCISDHYPITFQLNIEPIIKCNHIKTIKINFTNFDISPFQRDVCQFLEQITPMLDFEDSFRLYDGKITEILERHAPTQHITFKNHPRQPWFNKELRLLKRQKRSLERKLKKQCTDSLKEELSRFKKYYTENLVSVRTTFYRNLIDKNNSKMLYKTIDYLTGSKQEYILPNNINKMDLADRMAKYYVEKIKLIRQDIETNKTTYSLNHIFDNKEKQNKSESNLLIFSKVTNTFIRDVITKLNSKQSFQDPIPVWLLKDCKDIFTPIITKLTNRCLTEGRFPDTLKLAIITPIIKDKNKDRNDYKNYRPISTLPFLSKVIERVVYEQLMSHINKNKMFPPFQSAYRSLHSCETAVFKIVHDMKQSISENNLVALISLDLSSAFDTVDHDRLLSILEVKYHIKGLALQWFKSYLSQRSFCVKVEKEISSPCELNHGVPQGSILGPVLFALYISDIYDIVEYHGLSVHFYADDTQFYVGFDPNTETSTTFSKIRNCLTDIKTWMSRNFLKLNFEKTDVIFTGKKLTLNKFPLSLDLGAQSFTSNSDTKLKILGVVMNQNLSSKDMISQCIRSCYFNLLKLKSIGSYLDRDTKIRLVQTHILSRLDYCNILYADATKEAIKPLEKVFNASVRYICNVRKRAHITPYAKECHFLPIGSRIMYKCSLMIFKILNTSDGNPLCPDYLLGIFQLRTPLRECMRNSGDILILKAPKTSNSLVQKMVKCWNDLPLDIRWEPDLLKFKGLLKTHYFTLAYCG